MNEPESELKNGDTSTDQRAADPAGQASWLEKKFRPALFLSFFWIMLGVCFIYGVRLWHDSPMHPSFMPVIYVSFSVVTSFIVVMTLNYVIGPVEFEIPNFKLKGASGPIILWVICFLAIMHAFSTVKGDLNTEQASYKGTPLQKLLVTPSADKP